MVQVVTALEEYSGSLKSIFLAGGITNCPNWQADFIQRYSGSEDVVLFNPRRAHFDVSDESETDKQIAWEYRHLRRADLVIFWFPQETLCPIVLYELGYCASEGKPIVVGCHPEYARIKDVIVQLSLARPEVQIVSTLENLCDLAHAYMTSK